MYRILDLDNCISNDGWRIPRIKWNARDLMLRYHEYHLLAPWDACGNEYLFNGIPKNRVNIVVFTARPLMYRPSTEHWLSLNGVRQMYLLMRNDDDHRPSTELKRAQLLDLIAHYGVRHEEILDAYDDRPEVVSMYQSMGLKAHVAKLHDVSAYHSPDGVNHANGSRA